jgi:DUF438 domain-containing protein
MTRTEELIKLLQRLDSGEDPAGVEREAEQLLASMDPADLSRTEQELIRAGLPAEALGRLCPVHMRMLEGQSERLRAELPAGHVLHTMVLEHDAILGFLDRLRATNEAIQQMDTYDGSRPEFAVLGELADHLLGAEAHHQREEQVLFPAIEARGVSGPPQIMRTEHEQMRQRKQELKALADNVGTMDFGVFKERLARAVGFLVPVLGDHIAKENNILYPAAKQVIDDREWDGLRQQCDQIGYCCFSPGEPGDSG